MTASVFECLVRHMSHPFEFLFLLLAFLFFYFQLTSTVSGSSSQNSRAAVNFVRHIRETYEMSGATQFVSAKAKRTENPDLVTVNYIMRHNFVDADSSITSSSISLSICDFKATTTAENVQTPSNHTSHMSLSSPCNPSLVATLRSETNPVVSHFVDVWYNDVLLKTIDVSNKHGRFYEDQSFGGLSWSNDNEHIVYIAERVEYEKANPDTNNSNMLADAGDITDDIEGAVAGVADPRCYQFEGDWGESYTGMRPPVLVVLNICSGTANILPPIKGVSPGQPQFLSANGVETDRIIFTGYQYGARKYGVRYCHNNPSGIYMCNADGSNLSCIYSGAARSPRVTPSKKGVVFLAHAIGGPHTGRSVVMYFDLIKNESHILVTEIKRPLESQQTINGTILPKGFPGIYTSTFPNQPWIHIEGYQQQEILAFSSIWHSAEVILTLDINNRMLNLQTPTDNTSSNSLLSINENLLIRTSSTPAQPEVLMVGEVAYDVQSHNVTVYWYPVTQPMTSNISWQLIPGNIDKDGSPLESILVYPTKPTYQTRYFWTDDNSATRPLIVRPHGGPHGVSTIGYNSRIAGLVSLGFSVLLVNYSGSIGYGQDAVLKLIGHLDTATTSEIHNSVQYIHDNGKADPLKTLFFGDSFGGYPGALLAAKFPGFYRGFVFSNPIVNLCELVMLSDIPNYFWEEIGLGYSFQSPPDLTPELYARLWQVSPARLANKVREPVLILLGAEDRRIPTQQALSYYYRLKTASVPVECKVYPNVGHSISSVEAERDAFVSTIRFFAASLKR
ncbi:alpha/beta-hydrolase [Coemansia reversa NRRL 1564]|uniref:acylaminoacyl-peptidase n=1 Tax=Coemansia reversa (strain ATCC 12441 / NRRL 1564) TaxID=763665 RepID=A0A2G5BJG8_COERN|nr:alpha/beta-hydrolase [Coemansia reversa NRRL 1564]|eukprot:PIA19184.1 alpha/beta-hydrolase [Coemansia reversa NRRL 1564]